MFQILYNYLPWTYNDSYESWKIIFQDNATPQMEGLKELHNNITFYLAIFAVSLIMLLIILNYNHHGTLVELIWAITPALILVLIAFSSFKLLYLLNEVIDPSLVIYGEGHQWYWSYQYPDFTNKYVEFVESDSYIVPESDLELEKLRMLEINNDVIIPELTHTRFIVEGADVIHSYACSLELNINSPPNAHALILQSSFYLKKSWSQQKKTTNQIHSSRRSFSCCCRRSRPSIELQREITRASRESLWQAKENLYSHQDSHSSLCFDVAVREFTVRQRRLYMNRYQAWNDGNNQISATRETALNNPALTNTKKALLEAQGDLSTLTYQKIFLRDAELRMQIIAPNLTNGERADHSILLGERSELWARFTQSYVDHVQDLDVLQAMELFTG